MSELYSSVFSKLPAGRKVAHLFAVTRLGSSVSDFGRIAYGLFNLYGVEGLPSTDVKIRSNRDFFKLPPSYGLAFGQRVRAMLTRFKLSTDKVEDILSHVWIRLLTDNKLEHLLRDRSLNEAEAIIVQSVLNYARDTISKDKVRRAPPLDEDELAAVLERGDDTVQTWSALDHLITKQDRQSIVRELEQISAQGSSPILRDLPEIFSLLLEGYTIRDMLRDKMLPSTKQRDYTEQNFTTYRNTIRDTVLKHIEASSTELEQDSTEEEWEEQDSTEEEWEEQDSTEEEWEEQDATEEEWVSGETTPSQQCDDTKDLDVIAPEWVFSSTALASAIMAADLSIIDKDLKEMLEGYANDVLSTPLSSLLSDKDFEYALPVMQKAFSSAVSSVPKTPLNLGSPA